MTRKYVDKFLIEHWGSLPAKSQCVYRREILTTILKSDVFTKTEQFSPVQFPEGPYSPIKVGKLCWVYLIYTNPDTNADTHRTNVKKILINIS